MNIGFIWFCKELPNCLLRSQRKGIILTLYVRFTNNSTLAVVAPNRGWNVAGKRAVLSMIFAFAEKGIAVKFTRDGVLLCENVSYIFSNRSLSRKKSIKNSLKSYCSKKIRMPLKKSSTLLEFIVDHGWPMSIALQFFPQRLDQIIEISSISYGAYPTIKNVLNHAAS